MIVFPAPFSQVNGHLLPFQADELNPAPVDQGLTGRQQSVSLPRLRLGVAWENGFQHSGSRWFADTEEVTLTEPEDPRRVTGQLSETVRFCDRRHSPTTRAATGVQNPCPKST